MGLWSFYFIAKVALYFDHMVDFHALPNLALAAFAMLPARQRRWWLVKQLLAVPCGVALLYYDSYLPPFGHLISQAGQLAGFRASYVMELAGRLVNPWIVLGLLLLLSLYVLLSRKLRMSSFAVIALAAACTAPLLQHASAPALAAGAAVVPDSAGNATAGGGAPTASELNIKLNKFYADQATRRVAFPGALERKAPFDIVYLHVCSLAQDDLDYVGQANHPLFRRFGVRFNNFSTGASYSGPAAIRLLRSTCGQPRHDDLYKPADGSCYLFGGLKQAGFEPQWVMNHSGHFGNFAGMVRAQTGLEMPPLTFPTAAANMRSFDDSPVQDDYDVLSRWWAKRLTQNTPQVALYYNTVSLHDGNRLNGAGRMDARESYAVRSKKLLDDFSRFIDLVEASGRRMVLIMVPEHGANVRGDKMQISGLREIPSPAIALAPVGIKLIGLPNSTPPPEPIVISTPTAHLAVSHVLSQFLINSPFDATAQDLKPYLADLPQTEFVAENDGMIMMRDGGQYYLRNPDTSWVQYTAE